MKNLPKKIYLQLSPDWNAIEDFNELTDVTWCTEKINEGDVEYVLVNQQQREAAILQDFVKKISKQENIPTEFQKIVDKEFWTLI